jgi:hypothetical protein
LRPLTVVTGILLGSSFAIAASLAAVMIVFLILAGDYPRLQYEFRALTHSLLIFTGMTAAAALSFYALIKNHPRWLQTQLLMWAALAGIVIYYLPR